MTDLDTVKVVLRSLLMSTKRVMSTYDLQKDFRLNEGYECPYMALGYRSFAAFLESIPDTVQILPGGTVRAVLTEETQHIARLVALQKAPNKSKPRRGGYSSSGSYGRSSSYSRPPRFQSNSQSYSYNSRPQRSYSSSSYETSRPYSSRDAGSRTYGSSDAASRTYSSQDAASRTYSSQDAASRISASTSGASGSYGGRPDSQRDPAPYASVEKFFEKVREVKKARTEELLSNHVSRSPSPAEAGWSGESFLTDWGKQHENAVEDPPRRVNYCPERYSSEESDDSFYDRFKDEDGHDEEEPIKFKSQPVVETAQTDPLFQSSNAISDPLKNNIKNLIKAYPEGLWACVLPEKYQEKYGVSLQWNELGYDSVVQMVHDLQDILVCKRVQGGDWKLYDATLPLPQTDTDNIDRAADKSFVSDTVKTKIFDVVKKYSSGIRAEQLVELYHEYYSRSLLLDAPGFDSAESLFISIDGTVIRLRYIRQECYVLPGKPPVVQPAVEVSVDDLKELKMYPSEVMGPKESYPPLQMPDNLEPGGYLALKVAEVYNPLKFWIMFLENSAELDKLMDELQDFYNDHGDKYLMPESTIVPEQCCAAVYEGEWHRATIKSVAEVVHVFYVDYGTEAVVTKDELRFIHRDFSTLPAQAIQAMLSGIQPVKGKQTFTMEANRALLDLVAGKDLIGLIQRIEPEKPLLELFLVDTTGETDIHVNDVLVSENHAMFIPELLTTETKEPQENKVEPKVVEPLVQKTTTKPEPLTQPTLAATDQTCTTAPKPPPGFNGQAQIPTATALPGGGIPSFNNVNSFNPMFNQTLPAYSPAYLPQMNAAAALLQQQQAYMLAYYNQLYQQSLLNLRMAAASSWMGSNVYQPSATAGSPAQVYESPSNPQSKPFEPAPMNPQEKSQSTSGIEGKSWTPGSSMTERSLLDQMNTPSRPAEGVKKFSLTPMSDNSSSNSISDLVEHLDEQGSDSTSLSSFSHCNVAPDLVQSVGNLSLNNSLSVTNYWKIEEVCQKKIHIFNIDQKAFVSVGELARKFTVFSTSDSLLRVLKNKGIRPELKKITRQDNLSLFSSLDGCSEELRNSFDVGKNNNGNAIGTFNLCPLSNVPAVLIPLGTDVGTINGFRILRDAFNPSEDYWRC